MPKYRIRTTFDATGERVYETDAENEEAAKEKLRAGDLRPITEDYSIEKESTEDDDIDIAEISPPKQPPIRKKKNK